MCLHKWSRELVDRSFVGHPLGLGRISVARANEPSSWPLRAQRVLEAEPRCYRAIKSEHSFWLPENTELDKKFPSSVHTGMGGSGWRPRNQGRQKELMGWKGWGAGSESPKPREGANICRMGSGGPQGEPELDIKQKHPLTLSSMLTLIWGHQCSKCNNMGTFRA